jgi:site-specific DNA recombinase
LPGNTENGSVCFQLAGVVTRRWLDEIAAGTVTDVEQIAAREKCSVRKVNMTMSLALLAPDLVKAAVEGRLPRGIGVARLCDAPAE